MSDPTSQEPDRSSSDDGDPLAVTLERMREMARPTVEPRAQQKPGLRARSVVRRATPKKLAERMLGAPPERGRPFELVLDDLRSNVLPLCCRLGHPANFA